MTSSLLALPGEIRNAIYAHCVDRAPRLGHVPLIKCPSHTPCYVTFRETRDNRGRIHRLSDRYGAFFGLTQTCRLLRTEFRPIYLAQTKVYVPLEASSDYIAAFYPTDKENRQFAYQGTFVVGMEWHLKHAVDILPILKLRLHSPEVKVSFVCQNGYKAIPYRVIASLLHDLNRLLKPGLSILQSDPTLCAALAGIQVRCLIEKEKRTWLHDYPVHHELVFQFKSKVQVGWMDGKKFNPYVLPFDGSIKRFYGIQGANVDFIAFLQSVGFPSVMMGWWRISAVRLGASAVTRTCVRSIGNSGQAIKE